MTDDRPPWERAGMTHLEWHGLESLKLVERSGDRLVVATTDAGDEIDIPAGPLIELLATLDIPAGPLIELLATLERQGREGPLVMNREERA